MIKVLFLFFSIVNAYYLLLFETESTQFLQHKQYIGPIDLKKSFGNVSIFIYSDGYIQISNKCRSISVFQLNQSVTSDLFYSELKSSYFLSKYSNKVKRLKRYFLANWGFIITWTNHLVNTNGQFNIFQMIILTNGYENYAIFNYNKLKTNYEIFVGYKNNSCHKISFFEILNSGFLLQNSNVKSPGMWVFRIDNMFSSSRKLKANLKIILFLFINFIILN